jgi:heat-inducible transcriptional repressor
VTKIELSNRQLEILSAIVANYIKNGVPVSSGTVYAVLKLNVCASTIRSDMSYLTDRGFIRKLHTSSGSVPSAEGYKLYAKKIASELRGDKLSSVRESSYLSPAGKSIGELLLDLLNVVSKATKCLSYLYFQNSTNLKIENIRLVKITDSFLSIFVVFSGEVVKSKNLRVKVSDIPENELSFTENMLNDELCGHELCDISTIFIQKIAAKNCGAFSFLADILFEICEMVKEFSRVNFYFSEIPFDMFNNFKDQLKLLPLVKFMKDKSLLSSFTQKNNALEEGLTVSIGRENSYLGLTNYSIVSCKYKGFSTTSGNVGVIGSMRMDYSSVIPTLSYVSSFLKRLFPSTSQ